MADETDEDPTIYLVVQSAQQRYSLWPADRNIPAGWRHIGASGSRATCLQYIEQVWTELTPALLRR